MPKLAHEGSINMLGNHTSGTGYIYKGYKRFNENEDNERISVQVILETPASRKSNERQGTLITLSIYGKSQINYFLQYQKIPGNINFEGYLRSFMINDEFLYHDIVVKEFKVLDYKNTEDQEELKRQKEKQEAMAKQIKANAEDLEARKQAYINKVISDYEIELKKNK